MKKFKFRLESLFRYRSEIEKQAQLELAQLREVEAGMKTQIEEIKQNQKTWARRYNECGTSVEEQRWSLWIEPYLVSLEQTRMATEEALCRHQVKVFKCLKKTEDAYRAKRQVEILKERDHQKYLQEMNRLEQKEIGEISTIRFIRQRDEWREKNAD
ncbi:MAG: hypothetical protein HQM15_04785 [Deltaproteobacteria bacterium]|nr:hypothetical protein [Deltaproteobacteria bacterium]